jgi:Na+-driven multidrug efflux pump
MDSVTEPDGIAPQPHTSAPPEPTGEPAGVAASLVAATVKFSASILLGLLASLVLQMWTVAYLGRLGGDALYVRSIYAPIGFLVLAVTEGLVVAAQVSAGIATRGGRRDDAVRPIPTYLAVGGALLTLTAAVFVAGSGSVFSVLDVVPSQRFDVLTFVVAVCITSALSLVPHLGAAVLRGVGRPGVSSVLGLGFTVLSMVGMVILGKTTSLGALTVPVGGLLAAVVVGIAAVVSLRRHGLPALTPSLRRDAIGGLWAFGAPVAATFLLLSMVTFGYLWVLRDAGTAEIAGFSLGQMATSFFMVVALAVGSGAAIVANLRPGERRRGVNQAGMLATLWVALPAYLVISAGAYLLRRPLSELLTSDRGIATVAADYFAWIGPTFALFGGTLALLTFLEQIGRARAAFALNAIYFAVVLAIAVALPQPVDSATLAKLLAASNLIGFVTLWFSTRYLIRRAR